MRFDQGSMRHFLMFLALMLCSQSSFARASLEEDYTACLSPSYPKISEHLRLLFEKDQNDRANRRISDLQDRDRNRRKEVAKIFADGCLITGEDYFHAAKIFHHGHVPEHSYQAYLWARRAVELGFTDARTLVAKSVDRYLARSGYKQIFGMNAICRPPESPTPVEFDRLVCCLVPVVNEIPDELRARYGIPAIEERINWVKELNSESAPNADPFCENNRKAPPRNLFPGIW